MLPDNECCKEIKIRGRHVVFHTYFVVALVVTSFYYKKECLRTTNTLKKMKNTLLYSFFTALSIKYNFHSTGNDDRIVQQIDAANVCITAAV
jgi:hypothetical protein